MQGRKNKNELMRRRLWGRPGISVFGALAVGALLTAGGPSLAWADFASGLEAWQAGDYVKAAAEWTAAAESGELAAMRNLGHLYRWGRGVPMDPKKAEYWYQTMSRRPFGLNGQPCRGMCFPS
jgi:hypothetical protein